MQSVNSLEIIVKWNKETFQLNQTENDSLDHLRASIYSLTAVQPEKQKIIFKGKILKEGNQSLKDIGVMNVVLKEDGSDVNGTSRKCCFCGAKVT